MSSLMDRLRQFLGAPGHGQEHVDIRDRMADQQIRLDRLDANVDASRALAAERRRLTLATHPHRRAEDRP